MSRILKRVVRITVRVTWLPLFVCTIASYPYLLGMYHAFAQKRSAEAAVVEETLPVTVENESTILETQSLPWVLNIADYAGRSTGAFCLLGYRPREGDMIQMDLVQSEGTRSVWYVRRGNKTTTVVLEGVQFGTTFDPTLPPPERIVSRTP